MVLINLTFILIALIYSYTLCIAPQSFTKLQVAISIQFQYWTILNYVKLVVPNPFKIWVAIIIGLGQALTV